MHALWCAFFFLTWHCAKSDVQAPYRLPNKCEVCKILTLELKARLEDTGRNKEILRLGHGIDENKKKKIHYQKSELRLIEALHEPHICDSIKDYNVHAERDGSNRYAKGMSETMRTLHGLKNKGVKVELGIPYDLWDAPNAEVTRMQKECYQMVENHDEAIEDWYMNDQKMDLAEFLCARLVLPKGEAGCLHEVWTGEKGTDADATSGSSDAGKADENDDDTCTAETTGSSKMVNDGKGSRRKGDDGVSVGQDHQHTDNWREEL